ncbi:PadR family transcriptional regulator [Sandarakinorhabdus sp.]|uniref:PadR family transcriptional regulator n=1 Tax=Sandarakinorhabdus sp. TaxID=1916663 RepID=UPI00286D7065|nr:PadR family transcriptional regulator [Sandarakinorhabdus sp.]
MHFRTHCGGSRREHRQGARWSAFAQAFGAEMAGQAMRGGFGRRRMFDGDALRMLLLKLISDAPRHGYELIKEIGALSGGFYTPSPGMVYPMLTLLADQGMVEEQADGSRRRFAITPAGQAELDGAADTLAGLLARLAEMAAAAAPDETGPVRRGMANIRMAVQTRMAADGAGKDTAFDIAAILDEAARKIERL